MNGLSVVWLPPWQSPCSHSRGQQQVPGPRPQGTQQGQATLIMESNGSSGRFSWAARTSGAVFHLVNRAAICRQAAPVMAAVKRMAAMAALGAT